MPATPVPQSKPSPAAACQVVLALVDLSDLTGRIVGLAGELTRAFGATAYLIHVDDLDSDYDGPSLRADVSRQGLVREVKRKRRILQAAADAERSLGTRVVSLVVRGSPVAKAIDELNRRKPDLVIVGRRRHCGLFRPAPGNVGAAVGRRVTCPVVNVPAARVSRRTIAVETFAGAPRPDRSSPCH